jgi:hypothetical protein
MIFLYKFTQKKDMLNYRIIQTERQWKAVTGLSSSKFAQLAQLFGQEYMKKYGSSIEKISSNLNIGFLLPTNEDCLFFILFQLKNGLTYDSLGVLIGTDNSNAQRNFEKYLSILESALSGLGLIPKRHFKSVEEFEEYFIKIDEIVIDATEHLTQRPKGNEAQKLVYSGKKSTYF